MNSYPQKPVVDRPKNVSQGGCHVNRVLGLILLLFCVAGLSLRASAQTFKLNHTSDRTLLALESCQPPNGYIDPGETNTVTFLFVNNGAGDVKNVKVSLSDPNGNIIFQGGAQNIGTVANNATASVTFTFRAGGSCGGTLTPVLHVTGDSGSPVDLTYDSFQLGATVNTTYSFANGNAITINANNPNDNTKLGRASPYPSTVSVSNVPNDNSTTGEHVTGVTVTLNNLTFGWSPNLQAVLVGPKGQQVVLMANAGGVTAQTAPINNVNLTFSDGASGQLPNGVGASQITSGTYKPSNFGAATFPDFNNSFSGALSAFNALDATGTWSLYVLNTSAGFSGAVSGGWTLNLITSKIVCCGAGQTFPAIAKDNTFLTPGINDAPAFGECGSVICTNNTKNPVALTSFFLSDLVTSPGSLGVTVSSDNETLIKAANISVGGSGNTRTLSLSAPELNQSGTANITVTVSNGAGKSSSSTFKVTVNFIDQPPTVSQVLNQSFTIGTTSPVLPFTIGDVETDPNFLIVTATSDRQDIVPNGNIFLSGSGANRTVQLTPICSAPACQQPFTVRVFVSDQVTAPTEMDFTVAFNATAGNPLITPIGTVNVAENKSVTVPFNVFSTKGTAPGNLIVNVTGDDNTTLLPNSGIVLGGSGSSRTITLTPAANTFSGGLAGYNAAGLANVILTVTDPAGGSSTSALSLNVTFVDQPPTISTIPNQAINESADTTTAPTTGAIAFTVGDLEDANRTVNSVTGLNLLQISTTTLSTSDAQLIQSITPGGSGANRTLTVTANPGHFGTAVIQVTVTDAEGSTASTTFVLTVNAVNHAPNEATATLTAAANPNVPSDIVRSPADGGVFTIPEDSGTAVKDSNGNTTAHTIVVNLSGIDAGLPNEASQTVSLSATSSNSGILSVVKVDPASVGPNNYPQSSTLTLQLGLHANTASSGTISIPVTLVDNGGTAFGGSNSRTVTLKFNVQAFNYPPSLTVNPNNAEDLGNVPKNLALSVPISASDIETPTPLLNLSGALTSADPQGVFQGIIFDPLNTTATILLKPIFTAAYLAANPNALPYTLSFNVTATDQATGNLPSQAAQSVTKSFSITIQNIAPTQLGINSSTVTVNEDQVGLNILTLTDSNPLEVNGSPSQLRPLFQLPPNCANSVGATTELSGSSDNPSLLPASGILFGNLNLTDNTGLNGSRTVALVPVEHQSGTANVTITAVNSECLLTTSTFQLVVKAVPHAPTISLDQGALQSMTQNNPITVKEDAATADSSTGSKLLEFDVDSIDGGPANVTVTADSNDHTLVPVSNIVIGNQGSTGTRRTLTITGGTHLFGNAIITLTAKVNSGISAGLSSSATVYLQITHVNQPPTIDQQATQAIPEDTTQQSLTLTGITPGPANEQQGATSTATQLAAPQTVSINWVAADKGTRTFNSDGSIKNNGSNSLILDNNGALVTSTPGQGVDITQSYNTANNKTAALIYSPAVHKSGTATIYVTVTDNPSDNTNGDTAPKSTTMSFDVNITGTDYPPTISFSLTDTTVKTFTAPNIPFGGQTQVIPFYVKDVETSSALLTVAAVSSNPTLIPNDQAHLQLGGSSTNRGIIISPAGVNVGGTAAITLTVTDAAGLTDHATINVTVLPNNCPTISQIPDQTVQQNQFTSLIFFNVSSASTPQNQLKVTIPGLNGAPAVTLCNGTLVATGSDNTTLVPLSPSNIQFGTINGSQAVIIAPAANQTGTAHITIVVTDANGNSSATTFAVHVLGPPPTISPKPLADQTIKLGTNGAPQTVTVSSGSTFPGFLTLSGHSSNQAVVPDSNIITLGSGATRTVIVSSGNTGGTALITITVTDTGGQSDSTTFNVTVVDTSLPPTVSTITDQSTLVNTATPLISFIVGDPVYAASSLTATASSSNTSLVPNSAILILQSGQNPAARSMIITPAQNQSGTAAITITVTNPKGKTATTTFNLKVNSRIVANDWNGDGVPDIVLQDNAGFLGIWYMSGDLALHSGFLNPFQSDPNWRIVDSADIDSDGTPDLLFQYVDGSLATWMMNGTNMVAAKFTSPSTRGGDWRAVAFGDFNGDGTPDILLQNNKDGTLQIWFMSWSAANNQLSLLSAQNLNPAQPSDVGWKAVAVTDLNGDGNLDVIFQFTDGTLGVWYLQHQSQLLFASALQGGTSGIPAGSPPADYRVVGVTDLNGDGKPDLLFQNRATGEVAIWYMNGPKLLLGKDLTPSNPGGTWKIVAPKNFPIPAH